MAMPSTAEAEHEFECRLNSSQVLSAQLTITRAFQITVEPKDTTTTLLKTSRHKWPKIPLSL